MSAHLGRAFTAAQQNECDLLIEAAERWIDDYLGRAWLEAAATEDHFDFTGPLVWLRQRPVTSITSVKVLGAWNDTTETTLVAGTDYEQRDLNAGLLYLPVWQAYHRVRIVYVPSSAAPPATIQLATKKLAGWWMRPSLGEAGDGIKAYSVGGELSVTFQDVAIEQGVPSEVTVLLSGMKRLVFA